MERLKNRDKMLLTITWIFTIVISELPVIILKEVFKVKEVLWFNKAVLVVSIIMLFVCFVWSKLKALFSYCMFIVLLKTLILFEKSFFFKLFSNSNSFIDKYAYLILPRLAIAAVIILFLFIIKKDRHEFFLCKGDINATALPAKFIVDKPTPWKKIGITMSMYICGITLIFLLLSGIPSIKEISNVIPLLPYVIIFAVINSFSENIIYRISFLATLKDFLGNKQALYLTTFVFAMGHYYGAPYGISGVLMAGFLGWFLSKSILETKGMFWAWTIHFLQDFLIMTFIALGSVVLGGA